MADSRHFDVLIVVTPADCKRVLPLYPRLVRNFEYGNLCFIGAGEVGELIDGSAIRDRASWMDENVLIPFDEVHAYMSKRLAPIIGNEPLPRGITGWYYQQFLKMQYSFVCKDEYYMVWDGDTIPCRNIKMFGFGEGKPLLDLKHEYHPEYFDTLEKILPGYKKTMDRSFISEHMLFKCDIMKAMIMDIESNASIPGEKYWEKIINAIEPAKIYDSSFSEFETYGTYVTTKYPDLYDLREWHSFRLGSSFFDMNTICDRDFRWLSVDFDAISFEKDQSCEGNLGYFDNPKVQKKISAKKLLQEAQVAFEDAYKEVWDDDPSAVEANIRTGSYQKGQEDNTGDTALTKEGISFATEYFRDELRDGFFVSETMKRYWAAQLVVLSEIEKICVKHGINWYADSGTLIGTVRHKGYIPWDDDIDIAMLRGDYEKFLTFAREELPEGYCILTSADDVEYDKPFGRITNSHAIDTHAEYLAKYHGCPFVVGVDIFPLDAIYDDPVKEENRRRRGELVYSVIKGMWQNSLSAREVEDKVKEVERETGVLIGSKDVYRKLLTLFEDIATECKDVESKDIALMYIWVSEKRSRYNRLSYQNWKEMPFEMTSMRVPVGYHEILTAYYGDYMKAIKGSGVHGYPAYREQEKIYREKFGRNPNRYHFDKDSFAPVESRKTFRQQQKEMLGLMHSLHERIMEIISSNGIDSAIPFLQTCQNAAITIGTALEGKFGDGNTAISCLERYCEKIYEASSAWNEEIKNELDEYLTNAERNIDDLFENSKEDVLFLLCKASWWDSVSEAFKKAEADPSCNVKAIAVPYFEIDDSGNAGEGITEKSLFEKIPDLGEHLTGFDKYDLEKRHPDKIIIQFPYDGFSGTIAIPKILFSDNLSKYTDELVYVPFLSPDPPVSDSDVTCTAMEELVEQPAVFFADKILVKSQVIKRYYIKLLVRMTGDHTTDYWENRIFTTDTWNP